MKVSIEEVRSHNKICEGTICYTNDVTNPEELHTMLKRSGGARSVPQIFINQVHIGGANELSALANRGELQKLIT